MKYYWVWFTLLYVAGNILNIYLSTYVFKVPGGRKGFQESFIFNAIWSIVVYFLMKNYKPL
jgi:hypothetical protein